MNGHGTIIYRFIYYTNSSIIILHNLMNLDDHEYFWPDKNATKSSTKSSVRTRFSKVQKFSRFPEPRTGLVVQFGPSTQTLDRTSVRFGKVQVWTLVQNQTMAALISATLLGSIMWKHVLSCVSWLCLLHTSALLHVVSQSLQTINPPWHLIPTNFVNSLFPPSCWLPRHSWAPLWPSLHVSLLLALSTLPLHLL